MTMDQISLSDLSVEISFTNIHSFDLKIKKEKLKTIVT